MNLLKFCFSLIRYQIFLFKYRIAGTRIGKNVYISNGVRIRGLDKVEIGNNVAIYDYVLIYTGNRPDCFFKIGNDSHIAPMSVINAEGGVEIGNCVAIGPNVTIYSVEHSFADTSKRIINQKRIYRKISIEDDVYIGANCFIRGGVRIGKGSVIGAGAVVVKDIPPYSVAMGIPARVIRKRFE